MPTRGTSKSSLEPHQPLHRRAVKSAKIWLVPHRHNDHRPHLIRTHGLALIAVLVLGVQATALAMRPVISKPATAVGGHPLAGSVLAFATDINVTDLYTQTNQQRAQHSLPALRLDDQLNRSAGMKANDMFAFDYWAHVSPAGVQPWYWFTKAGYAYNYAGENLAKDFDTTSGVMAGWMNSPGHRANILNPNYVDVGFAVENGTLQGEETTLVVAHYGSISPPIPVSAAPAPTDQPAPLAENPVQPAAPTPSPSVAPLPLHTSSIAPAVKGDIQPGTSAPAPVGYSLFKPLALNRTATVPTLITIAILLVVLVVYIHTHLTVWKKGLPRGRHPRYRLYAGFSLGCVSAIIIWLVTAGFGQVG